MQRGPLFRPRPAALAVLALVIGTPLRAADERQPQIPDLKVETYTLPNGLEVILHQDHKTPIVTVNLWYKVGSKNEKVGRTGFAHLFEHLMFQGSKNHDNEYFGPLEKIGANLNGSTSEDRTNYYETVPSNALELALWLESDRMGFLLPALTQEKLDNQRDVVKNERRQRVDNVPYGQAEEKLIETLYPTDHPYHHSVIGSMADLSAASLQDVSAFFRTYYSPNNASLVVAGDFKPEEAKRLIAKYFGPLPRGPEVAKLTPQVPKLAESKHVTMTDAVTLPRAQLVWPTVPNGHPDEQALDILAAVLGGLPKENRLYRTLMYDRQLAARVHASHPTNQLSGVFEVELSARPGQKLDELIQLADAEIERLKKDGPSDAEVLKAQNERESQLVIGLESETTKADFLNQYNVVFGDPLAYKREMVRLFAVTPADVKRVANQYLTGHRVRLDVLPGAPAQRAPESEVDKSKQTPLEMPKVAAVKDEFDRTVEPKIGPPPKFTPPKIERRTLSNGLELLVVERHDLPILTLHMVVRGGETLEPKGKEGIASLTASLLTEGTTTRDSLALAGALADIGSSLQTKGGLETSEVTLTTLTKHTEKALDLFTDVILNPTFPEREINRLKIQRLARLQSRLDQVPEIARLVFRRILYGMEHPYGRPDFGTPKSVESITRDDVVAFHKRLYMPNNATLIAVGDTTPSALAASLEKALKGWKPGEAPKDVLPEIPAAKELTVYLVDKPAAAQSMIYVGQVGPPRKTPDYFPLEVLNAALGGQFSSRINLNLREDKGYTYGAQSAFVFRQGPGPFVAVAPVQTDVTKDALAELMKEMTDVVGPRLLTAKELEFAKERIIKGFPSQFETTGHLAGTLDDLVVYHLPDDYYESYESKVEAVTLADTERVAKKYLKPGEMAVLVVGDRSKIEKPIRELPFAKVVNVLDVEGKPVTVEAGAK